MMHSAAHHLNVQTQVSKDGLDYDAILARGFPFTEVPHLSLNDFNALLETVESTCVKDGMPVVIEGWHEHPGWQSDLFSLQTLIENHGDQAVLCRDQTAATDVKTTLRTYIQRLHTKRASTRALQRIVYAKDLTCPPEWRSFLGELLPPWMTYAGKNDLLGCLPEDLVAENLMIYIGADNTWTPAHFDQCGVIGHNIMTFASQNSYAFWFMIKSSDFHKAQKLWDSFGYPLDYESYFASIDELQSADFPIYVVKQKLGDLVMVPSLCIHQVINTGPATIKVSWNRMTAPGMDLAINLVLPRYQEICRPEGYRIKVIIKHALEKCTDLLASGSNDFPIGRERFARDFQTLMRLFWQNIETEWVDLTIFNGDLQQFVAPIQFEQEITGTCDYCKADIWNRQFFCSHCTETKDGYTGYDLCLRCYALGRGCKHRSQMKFIQSCSMRWCRELWCRAADTWNKSEEMMQVDGFAPIPVDVKKRIMPRSSKPFSIGTIAYYRYVGIPHQQKVPCHHCKTIKDQQQYLHCSRRVASHVFCEECLFKEYGEIWSDIKAQREDWMCYICLDRCTCSECKRRVSTSSRSVTNANTSSNRSNKDKTSKEKSTKSNDNDMKGNTKSYATSSDNIGNSPTSNNNIGHSTISNDSISNSATNNDSISNDNINHGSGCTIHGIAGETNDNDEAKGSSSSGSNSMDLDVGADVSATPASPPPIAPSPPSKNNDASAPSPVVSTADRGKKRRSSGLLISAPADASPIPETPKATDIDIKKSSTPLWFTRPDDDPRNKPAVSDILPDEVDILAVSDEDYVVTSTNPPHRRVSLSRGTGTAGRATAVAAKRTDAMVRRRSIKNQPQSATAAISKPSMDQVLPIRMDSDMSTASELLHSGMLATNSSMADAIAHQPGWTVSSEPGPTPSDTSGVEYVYIAGRVRTPVPSDTIMMTRVRGGESSTRVLPTSRPKEQPVQRRSVAAVPGSLPALASSSASPSASAPAPAPSSQSPPKKVTASAAQLVPLQERAELKSKEFDCLETLERHGYEATLKAMAQVPSQRMQFLMDTYKVDKMLADGGEQYADARVVLHREMLSKLYAMDIGRLPEHLDQIQRSQGRAKFKKRQRIDEDKLTPQYLSRWIRRIAHARVSDLKTSLFTNSGKRSLLPGYIELRGRHRLEERRGLASQKWPKKKEGEDESNGDGDDDDADKDGGDRVESGEDWSLRGPEKHHGSKCPSRIRRYPKSLGGLPRQSQKKRIRPADSDSEGEGGNNRNNKSGEDADTESGREEDMVVKQQIKRRRLVKRTGSPSSRLTGESAPSSRRWIVEVDLSTRRRVTRIEKGEDEDEDEEDGDTGEIIPALATADAIVLEDRFNPSSMALGVGDKESQQSVSRPLHEIQRTEGASMPSMSLPQQFPSPLSPQPSRQLHPTLLPPTSTGRAYAAKRASYTPKTVDRFTAKPSGLGSRLAVGKALAIRGRSSSHSGSVQRVPMNTTAERTDDGLKSPAASYVRESYEYDGRQSAEEGVEKEEPEEARRREVRLKLILPLMPSEASSSSTRPLLQQQEQEQEQRSSSTCSLEVSTPKVRQVNSMHTEAFNKVLFSLKTPPTSSPGHRV
ncbi:hypothetical protein BGZ73_002613 [Actinomortierella ambigua]|nr:hypothetical protein BGZ73_002613 [Actinomortierella ambigua]